MACCGKGKKKADTPVRQVPNPPATPTRVAPAPSSNKAIIPSAPAGSVNPPGKYCEKCGWLVAISKYADPTSGQIIEKRSCTNRRCVDY